jgi:WD40 repeat protein
VDLLYLKCHPKNFIDLRMTSLGVEAKENVSKTKHGSEDELLRSVFRMFNVSANGRIDHSELLMALKELGISSCLYTTRRILETIDVDNSGAIEFDDFRQFFHKAKNEDEVKELLSAEVLRCIDYKSKAESGDANFIRSYKLPSTRKPMGRYPHHIDVVTGISVLTLPIFISTSLDGEIGLWDLESCDLLSSYFPTETKLPIYAHCLFGENDQTLIAMGFGNNGGIRIMDINTHMITSQCLNGDTVTCISKYGSHGLIAGTSSGRVSLIKDVYDSSSLKPITLHGDSHGVVQSVCACESGLVAAGYHSGIVVVVDPRNPVSVVSRFEGCLGKLNCMCSFGNNLYIGGDDFIIRQFDISQHTNEPIAKFLGHSSPITTLVVDDGEYLFSGSCDGSVRVWSLSCTKASVHPKSPSVKFQVDQSPPTTRPSTHNDALYALIGHNQSIQAISVISEGSRIAVLTGSSDMNILRYTLSLQ